MTEYERKLAIEPHQSTARTHIVIQPMSWYEGEVLCCGWGYLSDAMPEHMAHNFARAFPEAKVWKASDPLPEPLRRGVDTPCDGR